MRSPVAIDFDEDGRLYVVEFPEYNQYANTKPHGKGCVRLLEDTDGDGVYDKSTRLRRQPPTRRSAVACWDGGVFVGAVPDMLYSRTPTATARPTCAGSSSPASAATRPARGC